MNRPSTYDPAHRRFKKAAERTVKEDVADHNGSYSLSVSDGEQEGESCKVDRT